MALAVCHGSSDDRRKEAGLGAGGGGWFQPQGAYGQVSEVDDVFNIRIT